MEQRLLRQKFRERVELERSKRKRIEQEQAKEGERIEQEGRELEMTATEGLLIMNKPTSVATQTEVTQTKSVQAQTEPPSRSLMFYAISAANLKENDKYYTGLPNYYSNVFAAFTIYYSHMKADHTRPVIVKLRLNFS